MVVVLINGVVNTLVVVAFVLQGVDEGPYMFKHFGHSIGTYVVGFGFCLDYAKFYLFLSVIEQK